jgi:hypothetical protein
MKRWLMAKEFARILALSQWGMAELLQACGHFWAAAGLLVWHDALPRIIFVRGF